MASTINVYLNFNGTTEAAFNFYAKAFQLPAPEIMRNKDMPMEGMNVTPANENLVLHTSIDIGGALIMGTDITPDMGGKLTMGNNTYTAVHVDSKEEADRLFAVLSEGGKIEQNMADQPWGDYWGAFMDQFGAQWMINCPARAQSNS